MYVCTSIVCTVYLNTTHSAHCGVVEMENLPRVKVVGSVDALNNRIVAIRAVLDQTPRPQLGQCCEAAAEYY